MQRHRDGQREGRASAGIGSNRGIGEEYLAFRAAGLAVCEHLDRETRVGRALHVTLDEDLAAAPLHPLDDRRRDAAVRGRLAVRCTVGANPSEAFRLDDDADAARADIAGVLRAGCAEHDAAAPQIGIAAAAGEAAPDVLAVVVDRVLRQPHHRAARSRPHGDADLVSEDGVAVDDVVMAGQREAERVVGEHVVAEIVAIAAIELHAVGITIEPVAGEYIVVALQDLDPLRGLRVGGRRAEDVVGDEVEGGAAGELRTIAVVEKLVAQHLVVHGRCGGRAAIAVVTGDEHAGAAAIGNDAIVVDDVAARAMNRGCRCRNCGCRAPKCRRRRYR